MSVLKCKMCGANLPTMTENTVLVTCEYCGSQQTVTRLDDEKILGLFERANKLRLSGEFDKASGIYESIVAEYPTEAEAYWGLVLCKYGVDYVDDVATLKKIPTCHRFSYEPVTDDENLKAALKHASADARSFYELEAAALEQLRQRVLEVSLKEEPYDIFISYKETDENGARTVDSVIAQNIYQMLAEKVTVCSSPESPSRVFSGRNMNRTFSPRSTAHVSCC